MEAGWQLSDDAAAALGQLLAAEPEHGALRLRLIGHYEGFDTDSKAWKRQTEHILLLIRNQPGARVLATPEAEINRWLDTDAYWEARSAWSQHLESMPKNLDVLRNAAEFYKLNASKMPIEVLERAQRLDGSDPEWASELGHLYSLEMDGGRREPDPNAADRALIEFERAYELWGEAHEDRLLEDLAMTALAAGEAGKARAYADAMLSNGTDDWNLCNRIHHGHLTLGTIALAEGIIEEADARLLKAGKTPGPPQLNWFGPNMALAKALLERGQKDVVIRYFDLCSEFWNSERHLKILADWTAHAKASTIPDFRANRVY